LISWYIITRKRSMSRELQTSKEKEQKKLNEDLRQHLNKNLKQQLQRWKTKSTDQLGSRAMTLQQHTQNLVNKPIERKKQTKAL
ncbi:MAG: hypothetical protein AAF934_05425, partial [Bacteroidota bacterium]